MTDELCAEDALDVESRVVELDRFEWAPGGHALERKKGPIENVVLLEFAPGFSDPNWCERSHVLFVVEGELWLELADRTLHARRGQSIIVKAGDAHRAANRAEGRAVVFAVSDV